MLNYTNITPHTYAEKVDLIVAAGGATTSRFDALVDRWNAFSDTEHSPQDALNAALMDPDVDVDTLARLRVVATAAQSLTPVHKATVQNAASAHVLRHLVKEYSSVAASNYEVVADRFNETVARFLEATSTADPDAAPESLMSATAKVRTAWAEAPVIAAELSATVGTLVAAAELYGVKVTGTPGILGLTINAEGLHRRRVYEAANDHSSRGGHWYTLVRLGATIKAATLDTYTPYAEPKPMEKKVVRGERGHYTIDLDPEDTNHEATPSERAGGFSVRA